MTESTGRAEKRLAAAHRKPRRFLGGTAVDWHNLLVLLSGYSTVAVAGFITGLVWR